MYNYMNIIYTLFVQGLEAVEVRSPSGGDCKGSHRRPGARQKYKKVRLGNTTVYEVINIYVYIYVLCRHLCLCL